METEKLHNGEEDEPPGSSPHLPQPAFVEAHVNEDVLRDDALRAEPARDGRRRAKVRQDSNAIQACFPFYAHHATLVPRRPPRLIHKFPINPRAQVFRQRVFGGVSVSEWNDWHWQLRSRVRSLEQLSRFLNLTMDEMTAMLRHRGTLPLAITPYYAHLLDPEDSAQPLRRTVVPAHDEYLRSPGEAEDPLGEDSDSPVPGLVHRYPDRVLFLVSNVCASNCRYCTRSRMVGANPGLAGVRRRWERAIEYIENTPQVRDVLLSGGDPLTFSDEKLEWLLARVRAIPHVEILRIGTKAPVVLPQRITPELVRLLKRYHPLFMSLHFTHPEELTPEVATACGRLADAGVPLGSQTVLLSGINDEVSTMKKLMQGLLTLRVKPYYIFQCDPILGSAHFRTPVEKGLQIVEGLRGHTSGYAVPAYVIDAPGGGGKIPLLPEYVLGREGGDLVLRNYEGRVFRYPDPGGASFLATENQVEPSAERRLH
jgi:lysine 2,3-aminomutase